MRKVDYPALSLSLSLRLDPGSGRTQLTFLLILRSLLNNPEQYVKLKEEKACILNQKENVGEAAVVCGLEIYGSDKDS